MASIRRGVVAGVSVVTGAGLACVGTAALVVATRYRKRSQRLSGKVVLITGGSRGLGLALAEEFARKGARLALTARDGAELERARTLLRQRAGREADVFVSPCDLRKADEAQAMVERVTEHFGRIDILVNNAGVITVGPVEHQSIEDFRDVMDANFFSGLYCTKAVLPQMLARRSGGIVNITSIGGKVAVPHMLPYTVSKFAAVGFSEGLAGELRSKGVQVTTVCPGLMRTGSHLNALFKGDAEQEYRWFSLGASLPGLTASAKSAARTIVRAVVDGKTEVTITPQAAFAARFANVAPEATIRVLQMVNLILPAPREGRASDRAQRGAEVRSLELKQATVLGNAASRYYNQTRG